LGVGVCMFGIRVWLSHNESMCYMDANIIFMICMRLKLVVLDLGSSIGGFEKTRNDSVFMDSQVKNINQYSRAA